MKILSKIFFVVILLGVAFLNTTCGKERWFHKITYEGYVYHASGSPAQNISVVLNACNPGVGLDGSCQSFIVGQCKTDASGHFNIHANAARSGRYCPEIDGGSLSIDCHTMPEELSMDSYTNIRLSY